MSWERIKIEIKNNANSLIILGVVLILVLSYFWFFKDLGGPASQLFSLEYRTEAQEVGRELVEELGRLRELDNVDLGILNDPVIERMDDITRTVPFRQTGRSNPFAPF